VTGVSIYSTASHYVAVNSPEFEAYTVDKDSVAGTQPVAATTSRPVDSEVVVTYTPIPLQNVVVVYVDVEGSAVAADAEEGSADSETDGASLDGSADADADAGTTDDATGETDEETTEEPAEPTVVEPRPGTVVFLTGLPGKQVGFSEDMAREGVPENYLFSSLENVETFDEDTSVDQVITVRLVHEHVIEEIPVTRTIRYRGAGVATPAAVVQEVPWEHDLDLVTNFSLYESEAGFEAVKSPLVSGYSVDIAEVAATQPVPSTAEAPVNTEVVVTYTLIPVAPLPITGTNTSIPLLLLATALALLGVRLIRTRGRMAEQI
jgi:hypothetical protein